jgi:hypothetical protein
MDRLPVEAVRVFAPPVARADAAAGVIAGITAPAGRFLLVDVHQLVNGAARPDVLVIPGLIWVLELAEPDGQNPKQIPVQESSDGFTWTSTRPLVRGVIVEPQKRLQLRVVVDLGTLPVDITTIAGGFSGFAIDEKISPLAVIPLLGR